MHEWCIVLGGWGCYKRGNLSHILLCWPSRCMGLLVWCRFCIIGCSPRLGHHSCIVRSLVWVGNTRGVAWMRWHHRRCRMVLWVMGDQIYDVICNMGFPRHVAMRGADKGSIWNDGVKVSGLSIDQFKLLGLQDGLFLRMGMFGGTILGYRW